MLPYSCLVMTCLYIFTILITCVILSHQETYNYKVMEIIDDLPVEIDMEKYLSALRRMVQFVDQHKFYVDIDLCFLIYLINGFRRDRQHFSLGHCLNDLEWNWTSYEMVYNVPETLEHQDEFIMAHLARNYPVCFKIVYLRKIVLSKSRFLSHESRSTIVQLVNTNEKIIRHFVKTSKEESGKNEVPDVLIQILNIRGTRITWPDFKRKFHTELLNETKFYTKKELEVIYYKWSKYKKTVYEYKKGYTKLENCLTILAQNPVNNLTKHIYCQLPYDCLKYIREGFDYGYVIAHRLLFLLAARFWRRCVITSTDKVMIDKLCVRMYNELEYMSNHQFGLPDLFMDHMALCSFEGHAQFLRRSWIEELLDFQTRFGCFNLTKPSAGSALLVAIFQNISEKGDTMIWEESCNAHITGVAGVVLAAAMAFITEVIAIKQNRSIGYDAQ